MKDHFKKVKDLGKMAHNIQDMPHILANGPVVLKPEKGKFNINLVPIMKVNGKIILLMELGFTLIKLKMFTKDSLLMVYMKAKV